MSAFNVNVDPSNVPGWLVAGLLAAAFAAEILDFFGNRAPEQKLGLSVAECVNLCGGRVEEWTPYTCRCDGTCPTTPKP